MFRENYRNLCKASIKRENTNLEGLKFQEINRNLNIFLNPV